MRNPIKLSPILTDFLISLTSAIILGACIGGFCAGSFFQSWLAASILSLIVIFLMIQVWRHSESSKNLAILLSVTFLLRLVVGVCIFKTLPLIGYDEPVQNAGFHYSDAYYRDQAAFKLATSQAALFTAFTKPDKTDQYGGMLFMSATIYRFFSPDVSRPLLITLLSAFAMTVGVAFLWLAIQKRWSRRIAFLACWIYCLFPDSVFLGSSQMREPFLIALCCIGFWAILQWQSKPVRAFGTMVASLAVACVFSLLTGFVYAAIFMTIFMLEWSLKQDNKKKKIAGFIILAGLTAAALIAGWMWLRNTLYYDAFITKTNSGWISALIAQYGEKWNLPFVTAYGITQPLLPAVFFEPSIPFWVIVGIFRGLGWYCVLPILIYGLFAGLKAKKEESKWILSLLSILFLVWVVVSSARAGGDQWDNPRYRYMLLPFMVLSIAWAIENYRKTHSPWLWRWVSIDAVFLLFFFNFYSVRYIYTIGVYIPFPIIIGLILIISFLILAGGWVWDKIRAKKTTSIR